VKIEGLLKRNAKLVFSRDYWGATPLHWAAKFGYRDVVALLLANGTDVNAKSIAGVTPLHEASQYGKKDVIELLRQHGGHE
jgi:ankyrin repeat protein